MCFVSYYQFDVAVLLLKQFFMDPLLGYSFNLNKFLTFIWIVLCRSPLVNSNHNFLPLPSMFSKPTSYIDVNWCFVADWRLLWSLSENGNGQIMGHNSQTSYILQFRINVCRLYGFILAVCSFVSLPRRFILIGTIHYLVLHSQIDISLFMWYIFFRTNELVNI